MVIRIDSPNFGARRNGARPDLVVLHYTAMPSAEAALERLCDPSVEVSAHYLIGRNGACWQLVDEEARAWHAGAGVWGDVSDVNSRSIGIELDNDGASPFAEPLMSTLERLLPDVLQRWSIPPERVIGHSDMAPGRKIDPGRRFDWDRLARQRLARRPPAGTADDGALPHDEAAFRLAAGRIGYSAHAPLPDLLDAFRARFRQQASGPLDHADITLARRIASGLPVDPEPPEA